MVKTLFGLSNIAADCEEAANAILQDEALVYQLLVQLESKATNIRKESAWVITNAFTTASETVVISFHAWLTKDYLQRFLACLSALEACDGQLVKAWIETFARLLELKMPSYSPAVYDVKHYLD